MKLDLNADLGEGMDTDAALMDIVTSANIACGLHAGDEATMRATVAMALQKGVGIGAHPGYPDRANFGRLPIVMSVDDVAKMVSGQVLDLMSIAAEFGGRIQHVKPHGALSNQAMQDPGLARAIAQGIKAASKDLIFLAPAGTAMVAEAQAAGLKVVQEIFADRAYDERGFLVARNQPGALLHDADQIATRLLDWLKTGYMPTITGGQISLNAQSVCVHGDTPQAIQIAALLRKRLEAAGVVLMPF